MDKELKEMLTWINENLKNRGRQPVHIVLSAEKDRRRIGKED